MHQDESPLAQLPLKVSYYTIPPPDPEEPSQAFGLNLLTQTKIFSTSLVPSLFQIRAVWNAIVNPMSLPRV